MSFYPAVPPVVTSSAGEDAAAELLGRAGIVAVRLADLVSPARAGLGKDGRSALVAAGAGKIRKGDLVVFLKPVAVAASVVRRDGRVQAVTAAAGRRFPARWVLPRGTVRRRRHADRPRHRVHRHRRRA